MGMQYVHRWDVAVNAQFLVIRDWGLGIGSDAGQNFPLSRHWKIGRLEDWEIMVRLTSETGSAFAEGEAWVTFCGICEKPTAD